VLVGQGDNGLVSDGDGNFRVRKLEKVMGLEKWFEESGVRKRDEFIAFIKWISVLDPEERSRARKFLEEEWLRHDYVTDVGEE
jgi:hypothetical protein